MVREVNYKDIQDICEIYNYYIQNTIITFETIPVSYDVMENRIDKITSSLPFYVYAENGRVIGYTYATRWKERSAYQFTVESTIYVKFQMQSKGIGTILYTTLLDDLRNKNLHAVIGGIALPNEKSPNLHEKLGFKKVAHFSEVGYKFNKWIDVGYWEKIL
ncbi:MAG: N-acetyltransferase [Spirochaetales bacterium]|nr:N-acetyltransferase [Spirochaetales bacterium]